MTLIELENMVRADNVGESPYFVATRLDVSNALTLYIMPVLLSVPSDL